jgi:hypothetical protein
MASLLQRVPPGDGARTGTRTGAQEKDGGVRIRCPRCAWEPSRHDLWSCRCLHAWNTFDTGGVCPACRHVWSETQCPRCHEWSPHADWYTSGD